MHADADKQGLVQGMITGMRGLCNGLGPAMFGLIFSLFHVDLSEHANDHLATPKPLANMTENERVEFEQMQLVTHIVPGPPFVFGALLVILALMVSAFIPEALSTSGITASSSGGSVNKDVHLDSSPMAVRRHFSVDHRGGGEYLKKRPLSDDDEEDAGSDREYTVPLIHTTGAL